MPATLSIYSPCPHKHNGYHTYEGSPTCRLCGTERPASRDYKRAWTRHRFTVALEHKLCTRCHEKLPKDYQGRTCEPCRIADNVKRYNRA